jgi:protein involved in polysaccharide export with SLBB domain
VTSEREIQTDVLLALQERWPRGLFYRRNVGGMKIGDRFVKFGVKGQADVAGMVEGRAIEVECKRPGEYQTKDQRNWQAAVERAGGLYIVARSVQDAIDGLLRGL